MVTLTATNEAAVTDELLVVLTGTGNETRCGVANSIYLRVVYFTLSTDLQFVPNWLTTMLVSILRSWKTFFRRRANILAVSRGVQVVLHAYSDLQYCHTMTHCAGKIILAGGCIWQRQKADLRGK